ncbi:MAG: plasmid recombination protein [Ruminococcus sp.]|nr:plasmid recombination protein [Ruminococcus sp.]
MKYKRISFGQGKGSITHNNRTFIANNIDRNRIADNVTFISKSIGEVYEELFGGAVERYNARQKRNDRKIHGTYYEHLFHCKPSNSVITASDKRKSFYEDVVQIGKMEDSGFGTEDFQLVADCLTKYMNGFQARNPNFHVFNAVLHMDEVTPHLHIDYIPVGHYKRGMDTQNGIAQALKEMGYGEGKQAIARWRAAEVEVLNKICVIYSFLSLCTSVISCHIGIYSTFVKKYNLSFFHCSLLFLPFFTLLFYFSVFTLHCANLLFLNTFFLRAVFHLLLIFLSED